ncbi:Hypothetical protein ETEE_0109 [Edwardsiella anguillarum ET080813]|uniref:Uncharacterized protein n=1 Tax=Edwardsiella anguillarum ET080813 TaxID=667120 RepID=A0A076LLQ3_9GAMM|nr:Hypothetical protein ETEE_0109 [Edwardsiella anguillarum ET080813]
MAKIGVPKPDHIAHPSLPQVSLPRLSILTKRIRHGLLTGAAAARGWP